MNCRVHPILLIHEAKLEHERVFLILPDCDKKWWRRNETVFKRLHFTVEDCSHLNNRLITRLNHANCGIVSRFRCATFFFITPFSGLITLLIWLLELLYFFFRYKFRGKKVWKYIKQKAKRSLLMVVRSVAVNYYTKFHCWRRSVQASNYTSIALPNNALPYDFRLKRCYKLLAAKKSVPLVRFEPSAQDVLMF